MDIQPLGCKVQHIDELVLDIFGFSRGAAEARHFVCSLMKEYERLEQYEVSLPYALNTEVDNKNIFSCFYDKGNGLYTIIGINYHFNPLCTDVEGVDVESIFAGDPITFHYKNPFYDPTGKSDINIQSLSFRHVNIGDTVTHYGAKQNNDHKDLNLEFEPTKIGSLYHIMAMDEYRHNFQSYSIFDYAKGAEIQPLREERSGEDGEFKEFIVPGAHADVGGGYKESGAKEIIKFPFNTSAEDVIKWNKKFGWIPKEKVHGVQDIKSIQDTDEIEKIDEEGFYSIDKNPPRSDIKNEDSFIYAAIGSVTNLVADAATTVVDHFVEDKTYYMYRNRLTWQYELVTLKLMHAEAVDKKKKKPEYNRVPITLIASAKEIKDGEEVEKFSWKNSDTSNEKQEILTKTYTQLSTGKPLSPSLHHELRQNFIHHSSQISTFKKWIANQPSWEPDEIIFGKRVVYDINGDQLTAWGNSWFK